MIPFLPEIPAGSLSAPGLIPPGTAMPQDPASAGAGLDFAGLLDAALPLTVNFAPPAPGGSVPRQPVLSGTEGDGADPGEPALPTATFAAPIQALPTGKILPGPDAKLPPVAPAPLPSGAVRPETEPRVVEAANSAPGPDDLLTEEAPASLIPASLTGPGDQTDDPAPATPLDIALAEAQSTDSALAVAALAPALAIPVPILREQHAKVTPVSGHETKPLPAHVTLPTAPAPAAAAPAAESLPAATANGSDPAAALSAPDAAPQPAPPQALAVPQSAAASATPERVDTARPPAPQQETAIAQFGELREAMRSARPEMTLRHAEFGAVSLRLEATGASDWRAVLASRDPGFVPAIQAALAERAVAAASASADSGGLFMGQNGTSDQRYGASPNGGQGGLSPYLSQSGSRDGEAAPDHRRPSTTAAIAARGQDGEGDGSGSETRGLFA